MMEWISVEDRLPADSVRVAITRRNGSVSIGCYDGNDTVGFPWRDFEHWLCNDVTHWMPLPEPPVKE